MHNLLDLEEKREIPFLILKRIDETLKIHNMEEIKDNLKDIREMVIKLGC